MLTAPSDLAERLRGAYDNGPVAPLRDGLSPLDADGAYAVQALNTGWWRRTGRRVVGRKIGLTAKAVQTQLGVDQPDFGVLFSDMRIENGGSVTSGRLIQPRIEAEVALILDADLADPAMTIDAVGRAVGYAAPALEIVDSRIAGWQITFADTVADNGSAALFVLGDARVPLGAVDLLTCGMVLHRNGVLASCGVGAACLGHPLQAALWLARELAGRGEPLRAGDVVLTGALGPMVPVAPGDHVAAIIAGLGTVEVSFGEGDE